MATYFKAVRPDGGSFNDPSFRWVVEPGGVTTHPLRGKAIRKHTDGAAGYLSVSVAAADCTGFSWPCRLLVVEPVGDLWTPDAAALPNKRAGLSFRTVRELPAHEALGPNGEHMVALIERCSRLTVEDGERLHAAWNAAWDAVRGAAWDAARNAAWNAARHAARDAARHAAWDAVRGAVWDAAWALLVRDLIGDTFTQAHYDTLTKPWRTTIGPIHPDDPDWKEA